MIPKEILVPNHLGEHILKVRIERGLLQRDVARLIGTNDHNIGTWETGRAMPIYASVPSILKFLGYDPYPEPKSAGDHIFLYRVRNGLSAKAFCKLARIDFRTLYAFEDDKPTDKLWVWNKITKVVPEVGLSTYN